MAQILQHKRGSTAELSSERGSPAEIFMDETKKTLVVMDGVTTGGHPLAKESDIPLKVSDLPNDIGYITEAQVFSGSYNDLEDLPDQNLNTSNAVTFDSVTTPTLNANNVNVTSIISDTILNSSLIETNSLTANTANANNIVSDTIINSSYIQTSSIGADIYAVNTLGTFINFGTNASSVNFVTGINMLAHSITNATNIVANNVIIDGGGINTQGSDITLAGGDLNAAGTIAAAAVNSAIFNGPLTGDVTSSNTSSFNDITASGVITGNVVGDVTGNVEVTGSISLANSHLVSLASDNVINFGPNDMTIGFGDASQNHVNFENVDTIRLIPDTEVRITLGDGSEWAFGPGGGIDFPDGSTQGSAYPGPQTSLTNVSANVTSTASVSSDSIYLSVVDSSPGSTSQSTLEMGSDIDMTLESSRDINLVTSSGTENNLFEFKNDGTFYTAKNSSSNTSYISTPRNDDNASLALEGALDVTITSNTAQGGPINSWVFSRTGELEFPDGTVQLTATPSTVSSFTNDSGYWVANNDQITNWDTAYSWGDHNVVGYALSTDLTSGVANSSNWDTAYSWGDHSIEGYWVANNTQITNWDTAYSWGDHGIVGYALQTSLNNAVANSANWDEAYSWGDHASAGYITSALADSTFVDVQGDVMTGFLTLHTDPTQALHASTKQYVDNVATGVKTAPSCRVLSDTNLVATYDNGVDGVGATLTATANGALGTIDGISSWELYDGILARGQDNAEENGRYFISQIGDSANPWILTRCAYCDESNEIPGSYIFITDGNVYQGTGWIAIVDDPTTFTVGNNSILYTQFSGAGTYTAGAGLVLNATQFAHGDTSNAANLVASGRTYVTGLTFDDHGHVTSYTTGSETVVDTDTTYSIALTDGASGEVDIDLTAGGSGSGTNTVTLKEGTNVTLTRNGNVVTIDSTYGDTNVSSYLTSEGYWVANNTQITNWDTAYSWGDHAAQGYATTAQLGDSTSNAGNWDTAYSWGDHSQAGYWVANNTQITNWDTAYSWGDHSTVGYLTTTGYTKTGNVSNGEWYTIATADITAEDSAAEIDIYQSSIQPAHVTLAAGTNGGYGYLTVLTSNGFGVVGALRLVSPDNNTMLVQVQANGSLTTPTFKIHNKGGTTSWTAVDWTADATSYTSAQIKSEVNVLSHSTSSVYTSELYVGSLKTQHRVWHEGNFTSTNVSNWNAAIANVVEDTTPQLGGNLDLNGSDVDGTGNINITGSITMTSSNSEILTVDSNRNDKLVLQGSDSPIVSFANTTGSFVGDVGHSKVRQDTFLRSKDYSTPSNIYLLSIGVNGPRYSTNNGTTWAQLTTSDELTNAVANSTNWDTAYSWGDHSTQNYANNTQLEDAISNIGSGYSNNDVDAYLSGEGYIRTQSDSGIIAKIKHIIDNPSAYSSGTGDEFGRVAIDGNYAIVGAISEDDASGTGSGKAYIFNVTTGQLLHTLDNPNPYNTGTYDNFGSAVGISGNYAIVAAYREDESANTDSGKAYIFNVTTGQLLHTLNNPNPYSVSQYDYFGGSVSISGNYAIVGAHGEDDSGGSASGKAYIFDVTTGALVHTLDNPNAYNTGVGDTFGYSVAISGNYAIVGAYQEDDASGSESGKAYIFNVTTGALVHTLDNPNPYSTSVADYFGISVAISSNYAIVGAYQEDDASGYTSGKAYIFSTSNGSLLHTLDNPNAYSTSANDRFGWSVAISESYSIVTAPYEDDASGSESGKAYIFSNSTGELLYTIDNPNAVGTSVGDEFGNYSIGISANTVIIGAYREDEAGGSYNSGKAYIFDVEPLYEHSFTGPTSISDSTRPAISFDDLAGNFSGDVGHSKITQDTFLRSKDYSNTEIVHVLSVGSNGPRYSADSGSSWSQLSLQGSSGGSIVDLVASGSITAGDPLILNANGTVSSVGLIEYSPTLTSTLNTQVNYLSRISTAATYHTATGLVAMAYEGKVNFVDVTTSGFTMKDNLSVGVLPGGSSLSTDANTLTNAAMSLVEDPVSGNLVVAWVNDAGELKVAVYSTTDGTSVSFGTELVLQASADLVNQVKLFVNPVLNQVGILYAVTLSGGGGSVYGTMLNISGTTVTSGTVDTSLASNFPAGGEFGVDYDSTNDRLLICHRNSNGIGVTNCEMTSNTITAIDFGTTEFYVTGITNPTFTVYMPDFQEFAIFYSKSNVLYANVIKLSPSGFDYTNRFTESISTSISSLVVNDGFYEASSNSIILSLGDGTSSIILKVPYQGGSFATPTYNSATLTNLERGVLSPTSNEKYYFYASSSTNYTYGRVLYSGEIATNLTDSNYIGISNDAYTDGQTAKVLLNGSVSNSQASLNAGSSYFVGTDGTLTMTNNGIKVGKALSSTSLLLDTNLTGPEMKNYLDSFL